MRGPKPKLDRPGRLNVKIPSSVLEAFEAQFERTIKNDIPRGARAKLVTALITTHLKGQDGAEYFRLLERLLNPDLSIEERDRARNDLHRFHQHVKKVTSNYNVDPNLDLSSLAG